VLLKKDNSMSHTSEPSVAQQRDFIAEALKLESIVQYQERSVVSKQILDKKAGTLTLFAFDKGEGLSEHTAPYDASILILDGKAEINIGGKPHNVQSGELIIMPANVPHAVKAVERFKMLLIMIRS
jgi:quercetin dioxygenase-like cupin family protein